MMDICQKQILTDPDPGQVKDEKEEDWGCSRGELQQVGVVLYHLSLLTIKIQEVKTTFDLCRSSDKMTQENYKRRGMFGCGEGRHR